MLCSSLYPINISLSIILKDFKCGAFCKVNFTIRIPGTSQTFTVHLFGVPAKYREIYTKPFKHFLDR